MVLYIFYLSIFDTFDQIWNIYSSEKLMQTPRWAHGKQLLCELTFTFSHICRGPCENFPRKNQPRKKLVKKGSSFRIKSKLCVTSSEFLMCIAWRASQQHPRLNSKPLYFLFILGYVYPASLKQGLLRIPNNSHKRFMFTLNPVLCFLLFPSIKDI